MVIPNMIQRMPKSKRKRPEHIHCLQPEKATSQCHKVVCSVPADTDEAISEFDLLVELLLILLGGHVMTRYPGRALGFFPDGRKPDLPADPEAIDMP